MLKLQLIFVLMVLLFSIVILLTCSESTEPIYKNDDKFLGQVVHEVAYAILKPNGSVWTWGFNSAGTLGNGTTENSTVPKKALNLENMVAMDLTEGIGVAADREGNIWFWGNHIIWLEPPPLDTIVTTPVKISYVKDVKSLNMLSADFHILKKDGTVWRIQHDHNSPAKFIEAVQIENLNNVISISESLVLKNDGTLDELVHFAPSVGGIIENISHVKGLANVAGRRTLILKEDGRVWGWGKNDLGQLGNGTFNNSDVPVRVKDLSDVIAISANYDYNLALKKDGTVWFWGFVKEEGDTLIEQNIPVQVMNLDNVALIYADATSIVMKKDGTYWLFDRGDRIPIQVQFD